MTRRWLMIATVVASSWGVSAHSQTSEPEEPPRDEDREEEQPQPPVGNTKNPSYCSLKSLKG